MGHYDGRGLVGCGPSCGGWLNACHHMTESAPCIPPGRGSGRGFGAGAVTLGVRGGEDVDDEDEGVHAGDRRRVPRFSVAGGVAEDTAARMSKTNTSVSAR